MSRTADASPIGDDVGDLCGVMAAVSLVHVLDHLLPTVTFYVDVDVGRAVAFGRQEPFEQQAERHRIGGGDPERVTDRRVGGAPPPLAEDVRPPAELDDVPHDQEVAGEVELVDQRQFVVDRRPCPRPQGEILHHSVRHRGGRRSFAVPSAATFLGDMAQELHLVHVRRTRERRQVRGDERQVERRGPTDLGSSLDHARIAAEPSESARRPNGDAHRRRPGATGRSRRGCVVPAPPPRRSPADVVTVWRSGRCWSPRTPRSRDVPIRRAHRCEPSRADRRDPTTPPTPGHARTPRPAGAAHVAPQPVRRTPTPPAPHPCGSR